MVPVPLVKGTIPYSLEIKYGAARLYLKPAPPGTGIIAGGPIRAALKLSGIQDISAKILGNTNNKISNVKALLLAFTKFQKIKSIEQKNANPPAATQTETQK